MAGEVALGDSIVSTCGKGKKAPLYIHILTDKKDGEIAVTMKGKAKKATNLITGDKLAFRKDKATGKTIFELNDRKGDEDDYIIKVEF